MPGDAAEKALRQIEGLGGHYVWDKLMFTVALNDCAVKDADLELFAELPDVELLTIGNAPLTDKGLLHLRGLTKLTDLYLVDTQVTPQAIDELQAFLPDTTIHTKWPIKKS